MAITAELRNAFDFRDYLRIGHCLKYENPKAQKRFAQGPSLHQFRFINSTTQHISQAPHSPITDPLTKQAREPLNNFCLVTHFESPRCSLVPAHPHTHILLGIQPRAQSILSQN